MRLRPRWTATLLSLVIAHALAVPALAQFDESQSGEVLRNKQIIRKLLAGRTHRLETSAGPDPDTVYIGKSAVNHTGPDNYWNLYVGSYRPGTNTPDAAYWDWDNSVGIQAADSLHGWWPIRRQYNSTGGLTLADDQRPWWALDHGNSGNYVISQHAAAKRTFGVVGYWHADSGKPASGPSKGVFWSPLSGTRSAWCGLRQHADNSVIDQVTKNPYNQNAVQFLHDASFQGGGSNHNFPGYPDQIDQLLYRDIAMSPGQSLTVSFLYRTRMSTSFGTGASSRTGWFHGDPLAVTAGNFISSTAAGANAPQDSFMVYVGSPVNESACVYSDGVTRPVYDKQRRWFSEVIKTFGAGASYFAIFARAGNNPADTLDATPSSGAIVVPSAQIDAILGGSPGSVRLVFRCKTNRGFADSDTRASGYTSRGRGAVQVDDVTIDTGSGPVTFGDFELAEQGGAGSIDNRFDDAPAGVNSLDNWRSTGKPPAVYMHIEHLSNLTYNDLCGPPDSPTRVCNIGGLVLTAGNHDDDERAGDSRFLAFREVSHFATSPSINLVPGPGGVANSQGVSATIRSASDDWILWYDMYAGMFNLFFSGNTWAFGAQCYPAQQPNGAEAWGQPNFGAVIVFNPEPECFTDLEPFIGNGTPFLTSRPGGIPDSLRLFLAHQQQCFRFSISLGCNSNEGGYFDNVSLAFIDMPGLPGQASAGNVVSLGASATDIWSLTNDTFPANESPGLPGTAGFDTTSALIRTGINNAQATANTLRFDLPGDSAVVNAGNATVGSADDPALVAIRMDLVFRILPGPGNYQIAAGRSMSPGGVPNGVLLQVPTNQAAVATVGDASFWGQYMADPGLVSSGTHSGPGGWDPLVWNSCRMDTTEVNFFPAGSQVAVFHGSSSTIGTFLRPGSYMSTIHESDPKFAALGVNKFWCFALDTTKAATSSPTLNNMLCNGTVPAWLSTVPPSRTGWNGSTVTKEFTKILPDGLLTPGSHVQYFYRKSHSIDPFLNFSMTPDTNFITPQSRESSTDMHRWQQFSVLPDRWKNAAYGGAGSACMLYVDYNDRRGNEGRFVSVMDSIGGTATAKWGAHNGWHAPGNVNLNNLDVRTNMSVAVSHRNSQPGTTWDMYGVKAAESLTTSAGQIGSRLANRANLGFAAGRESRQGPTPEMLRAYYRMITLLSGDLNSGVLGPFVNRSQNDVAILSDFLTAAGGSPQPRGIFIQGDGFAQSEKATGGVDPAHTLFLTDKLGVIFRNTSYNSLAGNAKDCLDLLTTSSLTATNDVYGVANSCQWGNDVLSVNPALPEAVAGAHYEAFGPEAPFVSDVVKPAVALRNWVTTTSGYEIEHLMSRYCDNSTGRLAYYYYMLNKVFASICLQPGLAITLDTPHADRGGPFVNFMKVGDAVMRAGESKVLLGIAQAGRVRVHVYDVAGRRVRTLADRWFKAGEQSLTWDGADDAGRKVPRGVYFVRSSTQADAGRIVVLNH